MTGQAGQLIDWLMSQTAKCPLARLSEPTQENTRDEAGGTECQPTEQKEYIKKQQQEKTRWIDTMDWPDEEPASYSGVQVTTTRTVCFHHLSKTKTIPLLCGKFSNKEHII